MQSESPISELPKSVWAFVARMVLMAPFLPANVMADHATFAWLHLCGALANLPTLANLLAFEVNFTIVWDRDAWSRRLAQTFALSLLPFSI